MSDWTQGFLNDAYLTRTLSLPQPPPHSRAETLILSAFLTASKNVHKGAFSLAHNRKSDKRDQGLKRAVLDLVAGSPGLCATLGNGSRLLVLHDLPEGHWQPPAGSGIELRRVPAADEAAAAAVGVSNDRRWLLFEAALARDAAWDCAYMIDLTDVYAPRDQHTCDEDPRITLATAQRP